MKTKGLNELAKEFHQFQIDAGFTDSNITQRLMLVVSEISGAFEAYRKERYADIDRFEKGVEGDTNRRNDQINLVLPVRSPSLILTEEEIYKRNFEACIKDSLQDEVGDAIIRLLAFCGENDIDIEKHVALKYKYNQLRDFKYGGKKF